MADTTLVINKMVLPNKEYASAPINPCQANNHVLPISGDSTKTFLHVVVGSASDPFTLNVVAGDYSDRIRPLYIWIGYIPHIGEGIR